MRKFSVPTAILLLTACGSQDNNSDRSMGNNIAGGSAPIIDHRDVVRDSDAQAGPTASVLPAKTLPPPSPSPAEPSSETRYRAIGTEPFWAVTIKGSFATLERPDRAPQHFSLSRTDDGRSTRYIANSFVLTATPGPCSDGMSDAVWSDRVSVAFGEGTLKGCGGTRDDQGMGAP
ncbi:MAG TPA: membrane-like protein [Sphingobium sp.]|nr:membrane-like protein [Sphingobium sp.]